MTINKKIIKKHKKVMFSENDVMNIINEEKSNMGQDLHDIIGQQLTGILFLSKALENKLLKKRIPEYIEMSKIIEIINNTIRQTQILSKGLCVEITEINELNAALEILVKNLEFLFGVSCILKTNQDINFSNKKIIKNIYYIIQEVIINSIKHGKAKNILINLDKFDDRINIEIKSDGTAIRKDVNKKNGLGLRIIKYRAKIIDANLKFEQLKDNKNIVLLSISYKN